MNKAIAIATIDKLLGFNPDLLGYDKSTSALSKTFLPRGVIKPLADGLPHLQPMPCVHPEDPGSIRGCYSSTTDTASKKPYRSYRGPINDLMPAFKGRGARERLIRILLASPQLLYRSGFGLSTIKASKQLRISQQRLSAIRIDLVKEGLLIPVDQKYVPSKRAKSFRASGELASALKQLYPKSTEFILPESIPSHKWNETLGRVVGSLFYRGYTLDKALTEVRKIEGSQFRDRMKQAKNWYGWYVKSAKVANGNRVAS